MVLLIAIRLVVKWPISISLAVAIHGIALATLLIAVARLARQSEAGSSMSAAVIQKPSLSSR